MTDFNTKPTRLFWAMGILFLLWNLYGCYMQVMDVTMSDAAYRDVYGPDMAAVRHTYPQWATVAYGTAVWSGLLASVLFLMRRTLSVAVFIVSLIAAIFCFIPSFTDAALQKAAGPNFWVMALIVTVAGIIEIGYSRLQREAGILQ